MADRRRWAWTAARGKGCGGGRGGVNRCSVVLCWLYPPPLVQRTLKWQKKIRSEHQVFVGQGVGCARGPCGIPPPPRSSRSVVVGHGGPRADGYQRLTSSSTHSTSVSARHITTALHFLNSCAMEFGAQLLQGPKTCLLDMDTGWVGGWGGQGCIRRGRGGGGGGSEGEGGRGVKLGPPSSLGPPMVPAEGGPKILNLNPLDAEGTEAKFWLSASNIGRGGEGGV